MRNLEISLDRAPVLFQLLRGPRLHRYFVSSWRENAPRGEERMPYPVRDWMSSPVVIVDPDTSVSNAMALMHRRGIRSVVGEISERNTA